ncbi:hypothetical protein DK28_0205095 [Peptococcaceae bacterium SCADC1_2_3]|jgi:uncharacterized protein (DUF488 family)|nr:hypothetical protein DK28_0205095 [Peptococcaceae bacterium SCADC1_2_3]KFI34395.1 hypothetical protein HY00_02515 [Peptococcaceae bacterium SCADC1_2_3]HBQ28938.1 DUF488 domain-containing protein [Desulfotomaculum sp.]
MGQIVPDTERKIYTIGHSNHSLETFLNLLRKFKIQVVVDVRSNPYSRYVPHFNAGQIKKEITNDGIKYLYMGRELGGQPAGAEFYDEDGFVLYSRVAESRPFQEGITRLEKGIEQFRMVVMCSEENPVFCHRRQLISRFLVEHGVKVYHIRVDGRVQTEEDLSREEEETINKGQLTLFPVQEVVEWKSIQSVLPKKQQKNFSGL